MNLVVTVPGQPSTAVEVTLRAHYTRWPFAGMTLPVETSRGDASRLRVLWDEVPVTIDGHEASPDEIARFEALTGMDLNGDGVIGVASGAPGAAPDDRVAQLERLAALHTSGALTDAEFATERRRVLGS
jgi:hypothetical protein